LDLFSRQVLRPLLGLTILRYVVMTVRTMAFMQLLGLDLSLEYALYIMPLVQLTLLFNLTPGNLGIGEWTWVSLLTLSGVDATIAGSYSVAQRGLVFLAVACSWLIVFMAFSVANLKKRHNHSIIEKRIV
jgi:uncharacterized membrane protein YbhN (UPF0104 family)